MASKEWYDDLNTNALAIAGVLSILIFVVLVLGVQSLYFAYNSYEHQRKELRAEAVRSIQILDEQRKELSEYGWANPEKTKIAIPIDRAMQIVAADLTK